MTETERNQNLSSTGAMEEKIELYSLAVCGLYERMLNYAGVVHQTDRSDYMAMRDLVNHVYATDQFGFDLRKKLSDGSKRERIITTLEDEYKQTALIYKQMFADALSVYFENELNPEFEGNTLIDLNDRLAFSALKKQAGKRVHSKLIQLAADGDIDAQIIAGKSYFLGWGTTVDLDAGFHWLSKAARAGDGRALLYTGLASETIHDLTTGYRLNPDSISCYEAAYAAGEPNASFALYRYYRDHLSDRCASSTSRKWLRRGHEENNISCLYMDDVRPEFERFATGNVANTVDWIRAAAMLKEPDAFRLLGNLYEGGRAGLEKNAFKAQECYDTADQLDS